MLDSLLPRDITWLESFFSGRNNLKWEAVVSRNAPAAWLEQVLPWIALYSSSKAKLPLVLPVFGPEGACQWYGMALDESGANALAQELTAFIGPSFSYFRGSPVRSDSDDLIENALVERFGLFVFRLDPVNAAACANIVESLQLYLGLIRRRPDIPPRGQRPFGKVRGEFDLALLAGNEADARCLRDELISSGRIDAEQQKYLNIRMLAGLGQQFQLAHDYPLIKSILGLSLPSQTIADLVGALYDTYILGIEDSGDDDTILNVFRREIADNFGPLFLERKGVRHPSVLKAFILFELTQAEPNRERCLAIVSAYPEERGRGLVERWVGRLATDTSRNADLFESTRQALADEDYELALRQSFDALPETWAYSAMLRCAVEIGDSAVMIRVLEEVDKAPEAVRLNWTKRDLTRLQQLRMETSEELEEIAVPQTRIVRPDADWLSWAKYVELGTYDQPPLQVLEDALPRWSVEIYASDPTKCQELADRIGNASGGAEQIFRDAFALLVEFFVDRPALPVRAFGPLYVMLIRIVAWNGAVTQNELELASSVMQALVSLAPSEDDYEEAIDAYTEIMSANSAPGNVDWALNASEVLALHVSPNKESRLRFFIAVVEMIRSFAHRLSAVQFEVLSLLAKDYSCPELLDGFSSQVVTVPEQARNEFSGLIGIYTLTESAGVRAQQFLKKILPQARVEVNADHVATDKLKSLAKNSDIFVFAWRSSKHQAYYAAKESRGDQRTLLPLGKGSASILECVLRELERIISPQVSA